VIRAAPSTIRRVQGTAVEVGTPGESIEALLLGS
jgi:hypothetical protein